MMKYIHKTVAVTVLTSFLLGGCAGRQAFRDGDQFLKEGRYNQAVAKYAEAVEKNPDRQEYRMQLFNARSEAGLWYMEQGQKHLEKERYAEAMGAFQQAAALDPSVEAANQKLKLAATRLKARQATEEAGQFLKTGRLPQARKSIDMALQLHPDNPEALSLQEEITALRMTVIDGFELAVSSSEPLTLRFSDTNIRDAFGILSRLSGINFIFDEDIRSQKVTLFLEKATFAQALELLLTMNDLGKKVLNPKTLIVYPKTRDKLKQYEEQIIQTFYLSNIDAKKAVNLLRTMLQLRKIYVHEELNALVIRDTPDVIRLAEQVISASDRPDAEVIFDLELIEVTHDDTLTLGPKLTSYLIKGGLAKEGVDTIADSITLRNFNNLDFLYTIPSATFDFKKELTDSETLANPKIRVKNKQKAKVHVGSREPIITATITDNGIVSENIQYVDTGVKLDVEPLINLDNSVTTKITLELSNATPLKGTTSGTVPLVITTTNAQTVLTLSDGQRTIIGGLIKDDTSKTKTTFPFIGAIPILGDLISGHTDTKTKREILLSITPHIVQSVDLPKSSVATIWSGGEDNLKAGPMLGSFADEFAAEVEQAPQAVVPSARPEPKATPLPSPEGQPESQPQPMLEEVPTETMPLQQEAAMPAESLLLLFGPSLVNTGEEFPVEVKVNNVTDLHNAPAVLLYDPALLDFVRVEEGDFLRQGATATRLSVLPDPEAGQLVIEHNQEQGGKGASGQGMLFRVLFKAKNAGNTFLHFDTIDFQDVQGQPVAVLPSELFLEVR
ncbi:secretin N-terminal domain-containing protein [Desulfuromonas sp. AOP6]|uniref:secretin N-terminal domain-containing protein n=1 Tax=Desulfuromonas sp. AOP6 TaxID=1566351 RepID=UPI00127E374B|nr:secretin N-terminal domain-containing protein [Desulfuromonas sp. AOP6]BCA80177.1 type II secretion system protein [Desulfuromonas sp. AOP6]